MTLGRRVGLAAVLVACLLAGFAAGRQYSPQEAGGPGSIRTYAMNVVVSGVPFWRDTRETIAAMNAASPSSEVAFGGPTDTDAEKQREQIEGLLAKGLDGLVIAPADSAALAPVIDKAVAAGIPVVTLLVDAPSSKRLAYVSSELETASKRVATFVWDDKREPGRAVVVYAQAGNEEQEARRRGFEEFIASSKDLQLAAVLQDHYDERQGADAIKATLLKDKSVKYIFGANSRSAVGAVTALRELGYSPGQVVVTGWDTDKDVLDLIRSGWVQASVAQQSAFMAQLSVEIVRAAREGFLYPPGRQYRENGVRPLPEQIIVPVTLVNAKNVSAFYPIN